MELGHRHGLRSGRGGGRPAVGPQFRRDHLAYGDHTVSAYAHYVGGFGLPEAEFSIASHTEFDLFYQWAAPWDGHITLGVKNLTDEDPELGSFSSPLPQAYNLYSLDGRILYASYRHTF